MEPRILKGYSYLSSHKHLTVCGSMPGILHIELGQ